MPFMYLLRPVNCLTSISQKYPDLNDKLYDYLKFPEHYQWQIKYYRRSNISKPTKEKLLFFQLTVTLDSMALHSDPLFNSKYQLLMACSFVPVQDLSLSSRELPHTRLHCFQGWPTGNEQQL